MKTRCYCTTYSKYKHWGGRGITVCDRWKDDFQAFYEDVLPLYVPGLTFDRINNDGNYEPGNIRFADNTTQCRNRTITRYLEFNGERKTLAEWAETFGISRLTLWLRLYRRGWTVEEALTAPNHFWKVNLKKAACSQRMK